MREDAAEIFQAGLAAVAPGAAVKKFCTRQGNCFRVDGQEYDLGDFDRVVVLGAGKAGAAMAKAVEDLLKARIDEGLIVVKYGHLEPLEKIRIIEAGHPLPGTTLEDTLETINKNLAWLVKGQALTVEQSAAVLTVAREENDWKKLF